MSNSSTSIGFIGLGLMGQPMASRFIDAGYDVTLWNRSKRALDFLEEKGASISASIRELVIDSETIFLCVSDTKAVEQIVFGKGGISEVSAGSKILVDFSSIEPRSTRLFASKLQSLNGMKWIDAPVSGGVAGAEAGKLVVMAGGDEHDLDIVRPILKAIAQRVTYMGSIGSGQTTKICNQILVSCNVLVMAEVLALAERSGVDSQKIPSALEDGFADSIPLQITGTRMVNKDFSEVKWHVKTLLKDLKMAVDLSKENNATNPITCLAKELMQKFDDDGFGEKDPSNLIRPYLKE